MAFKGGFYNDNVCVVLVYIDSYVLYACGSPDFMTQIARQTICNYSVLKWTVYSNCWLRFRSSETIKTVAKCKDNNFNLKLKSFDSGLPNRLSKWQQFS